MHGNVRSQSLEMWTKRKGRVGEEEYGVHAHLFSNTTEVTLRKGIMR